VNQSERDRYVRAWGDRRARLFMLAAMVAGFAASVALWANAWLAGAFLAGALIGAYGYREFRCPRCHQRFLDLARRERCRSCGLAKNALPD
jgi:hypothetical protein